MSALKNKILHIKGKMGLSTEELASIIGVNKYSVYRWIQKDCVIQEKNLVMINRLFETVNQENFHS